METINTFSDENIIAEIYDDNLNDLRKGVYGKFIKDNHDGRHRTMAIQYLIDNNKIPKDTEIPVVIVTER